MDEPLTCRICYEEGGDLIRPCACKGTAGNIHVHCLKHWVKESGKNTCEICKTEYAQHDVLSCNMDRYCNALWTFRSRSRIEKGLTRATPLVAMACICEFAWIDVDIWLFTFSLQTLIAIICLVMIQIVFFDAEYFILNVSLFWSMGSVIALTCIGMIKILDTQEMCNYECMKLMRLTCVDMCPLKKHYDRQEDIINNTLAISVLHLVTFFVFKAFKLCFTELRENQYLNRRNLSLSGSASGEESVALLASSV